MPRQWLFALTVVLTLLLTACGGLGNGPAQGQAAAPPDATHLAVPIAPATPSATPASMPTPKVTPSPVPTNLPQITAASAATPPKPCPVTQPPDPPFAPPSPPELRNGIFWYGTPALWTQLRRGGVYDDPRWFYKIFRWRDGYDPYTEQRPDLTLTARRLDGPAPTATAGRATNAFAADIGSAMLNGIDLPTPGCWEFAAHYENTNLRFVVWLTP